MEIIERLNTPIQSIGTYQNNSLYIKREDLIPFSFGGNKARKAILFFDEIIKHNANCIVTYGTSSSNHCRVIANMAVKYNIKCFIISPEEASYETFNSILMKEYGAEIIVCPITEVHDTIEYKIQELKSKGYNPFFIPGGGHGNIGTRAFVDCFEEIMKYEDQKGLKFDYIFHASGTGTTQAGLICGKLIHKQPCKIVGISIARKCPGGRAVVIESVSEYLSGNGYVFSNDEIDEATIFLDSYIGQGYGSIVSEEIIFEIMSNYGIALDPTYTGKAFWGMKDYLKRKDIVGKNVLFIHTGGTPLFFDYLEGYK